MFKVSFVEDEKDLASLVCRYLKNEGYEVSWFRTGEEALKQIQEHSHLWILDIMLPGNINGYDLIKAVRNSKPDMPVIFTSARDQDIDKIMGLELGGDDYIPKPYSIRELMLRIKNVLSRCYNKASVGNSVLEYDVYQIDVDKRMVYQDEAIISLTSKEYDLLLFLLENKGKAFSRDQILDNVWGLEYFGSDRVVDDLMRRLRHKMNYLKVETIYGYGYRLL